MHFDSDQKKLTLTMRWIAGIAFSVFCFAVLFVVLGRDLGKLEAAVASNQTNLEMLEAKYTNLSEKINSLNLTKNNNTQQENKTVVETFSDAAFFATTVNEPAIILIDDDIEQKRKNK